MILVTGAGGFIGSEFIRRLSRLNVGFEVLSRSRGGWPDQLGQLDLKRFTCVVHLAFPKIKQSDKLEDIERDCLGPMDGLITACRKSNPECTILFVSSQSAKENGVSPYGRAKWLCEQKLIQSETKHIILRPGLVLGEGNRGLFVQIQKIISLSPVVPLIGFGNQLIQPVPLEIVAEALVKMAMEPDSHRGLIYQLAFPPLKMRVLLRKIAAARNKYRLFVPIPLVLIKIGLSLLEFMFVDPPLTRSNLTGLLENTLMETDATWQALGWTPPCLADLLIQGS